MLVLSRKRGERICIADNIEVTVIGVQGDRVRLGFSAPNDVPIHRAEVQQRIQQVQASVPCVPAASESRQYVGATPWS